MSESTGIFGTRTNVSKELLADSAIDPSVFLIAKAAMAAKRDGYVHVPGGETVNYIERDDPRWIVEPTHIPEGYVEARVTIRCVTVTSGADQG